MASIPHGLTRRQLLSSAAALPAALSMNAWSQSASAYPSKAVNIIVPFTAGGSSDIGARILAGELNKLLNVAFVADNVAGAGGAIGMQKLLRAAPDGYTFAYGGLSESLLIPMINKAVNYKTEDFVPVAMVGAAPVGIVTRPDFPANSIDEMIELVKKSPGKYSIGSAGIGSATHMAGAYFAKRAGIQMVHVPYNAGSRQLQAVLAGEVEIAIISLNGVVYSDTVRVGGDRFDEAIVAYVRRTQGSLIGEATAERIKREIGAAYPQKELRELDVRGRNLAEGIPRSFTLNSNEILEALQEPLSMIVQAVKSALEQCPPELAADIADTGMVLTGGGALLRDLDVLLQEETGLPVIVADDPLTCVARGGGKALEMMDRDGTADLLSTE